MSGTRKKQRRSSTTRFVAELGAEVKLNMRFKVSEMLMDGKLEY